MKPGDQEPTLDQILSKYTSDRSQTMFDQQRVFADNFDEKKQKRAIQSVINMDFGLFTKLALLNKQLMYMKNNIIYPITPIAREQLLYYWGEGFKTAFEYTIELIFTASLGTYSADTKGRALEKYVNYRLEEMEKFLPLKIFKIDSSKQIENWSEESISVSYYYLSLIHQSCR